MPVDTLGVYSVADFSNAVGFFSGFVSERLEAYESAFVDSNRDEEGLAGQLESLALLLKMIAVAKSRADAAGNFVIGESGFSLPLFVKVPDHLREVPASPPEPENAKEPSSAAVLA